MRAYLEQMLVFGCDNVEAWPTRVTELFDNLDGGGDRVMSEVYGPCVDENLLPGGCACDACQTAKKGGEKRFGLHVVD